MSDNTLGDGYPPPTRPAAKTPELCKGTCGDCETSGMCVERRKRLGTPSGQDAPLAAWKAEREALVQASGPTHSIFDPGQTHTPLLVYMQRKRVEAVEMLLANLLPMKERSREGLEETPARVAKAWGEWCSGYQEDPAELLKVFEDGAEGVNQMVLVRDIELYSHCEHHMAPFFGVAHIAYIPDGKIVGLSKLARVADVFAKRLQVQERLTNQIANCINDTLKPKGVGVVVEARHFCMCSRGVNKQGSNTVTSALRGAMLDEPDCRAEFFSLARG